jgi:hypothetical protein
MKRLDMAHRDTLPLAYTPDGPVYESDLDARLSERIRQVLGVLFFAIVLIAVCLLSGGPQ